MKTAYLMNINQFQAFVLEHNTYLQLWTPRETGRVTAICSDTYDMSKYKSIEVDIKDNEQLKDGQIIIIADIGKTINDLLQGDVYEEEFLIAFHKMLEKFVNEYDDMANMKAIKQANDLLATFNE